MGISLETPKNWAEFSLGLMRAITFIAIFCLAPVVLAEDPSGSCSAYGEVGGQHFKATVSLEEIRKAPRWSPDTEQLPPLAPGRAQAIARKQLDRIVPTGQTWYLDAVRIVAAVEGYSLAL